MHAEETTVSHTLKRFHHFRYALVLEGVAVGILAGVVVVVFRILLEKAAALLSLALAFGESHPWFIPVWLVILMLAALTVALLLRWEPYISGSGIPQVEGEMQGEIKETWWRVLLAKYIGGIISIGCGLSLGREGPSIQLGAMTAKGFSRMIGRMRTEEKLLITCGASAGLSAAFNAPLAGILFIIEEMRPQFRYNLISIKAVFTGVIMSSIVFRIFNGEAAIIEVGKLSNAPVNTLWLYLVLGMLFGCFGPLFNFLVLRTQDLFQRIHGGNIKKWVLIGGLIGGLCGLLGLMQPSAVGGGFNLIPIAAAGNFSVGLLLFIFIARVVTTLICFSSGAPGGIFAPMLALGTLLGTAFGMAAIPLFPAYHLDAGTFAIAGMGALLAASVRAPLTGIVLVLEMTDNYQLILPMIITCLGATLLAQFLGGKPLYSTILQRTLAKQEAEQAAKAQQAPRENT